MGELAYLHKGGHAAAAGFIRMPRASRAAAIAGGTP